MQYADYVRLAQEGSDHLDAGRPAEAVAVFRRLIGSDISDLDKSMMCINLAVIADRSSLTGEALAWFGRAAGYERPLHRFFAAEQRAAYLARIGRTSDALHAYQELLCRPDLTEADRERLKHGRKALGPEPSPPAPGAAGPAG